MPAKRPRTWRFNHPTEWFTTGRGKSWFPVTWEGWVIFLALLIVPFVLASLGMGH